ncbi:hypothetical protein [Nioella aestuarii]|uniref:hypothetical protein n=1 Tax=Nioella aestuarii TaxID=1662864 RepID=UPI003D7F6A77
MVLKRSDRFAACESGAATFDWVILAVGVFGLGLAIASVFFTSDLERHPPAPQDVIERSAPGDAVPSPLYPYHDDEWRRDQAAHYAAQDDAVLQADYAAQYEVAVGDVNARVGADILSVIEAEMTRRGLPLPEGNATAAEIRVRLTAETGSP